MPNPITCSAATLVLAAVGLAAAASLATAQPIAGPAWQVPAGAKVSVDRNTGRISILMPSETDDRVRAERVFPAWRTTPYAGSGPFPATRAEDPSLPTHTLYFPSDIRGPLPVVLWANGGCRNTSVEFTRILGEIASRGYFVIANGRNDVPFWLVGEPTEVGGKPLQVRGPEIVLAGLDWAARANAAQAGPYFGKLDLTRVAALGQSCGGGQVWQASKDPRIKTVVALNSSFPSRQGGGLGTAANNDWTVEQLAKPAAYFVGGPGDLAYAPSITSYAATPANATVVKANLPTAGHTGGFGGPDPDWARAIVGWLDWQLKGDARARALFAGADCGLCRDPKWWFEAKNAN